MIIITGAAGFIGSCILARLNDLGHKDILAVDDLSGRLACEGDIDLKRKNLQNKQFVDLLDKKEFLSRLEQDSLPKGVQCIIHMGACSSTTLDDAAYYEENNFRYSCVLTQWAIDRSARIIYASSAATYGDGSLGYRDNETGIPKLKPLNYYGQSKQKFDLWVLEKGLAGKVVGLKFFNVFGPNEYHKGDMRSVVAKAYQRVREEGKMFLFKSYKKEYADGEQKRDFIYVKDAVDIVLHFYDSPKISGIYNVGTGQARTWNDLARALFAAEGKKVNIEYIEMPEVLKSRYQYFTEADIAKLRKSGYAKSMTTLESAVKDYVGYLKTEKHL